MRFEWDPIKSTANLAKHGISFDAAVVVFADPRRFYAFASFQQGAHEKMNEESMVSARLRLDGIVVQVLSDGTEQPLEGTTDWARVDAMTDAEIEANAASDPDNLPLTSEEVLRLRSVPYIKHIRQRLGLTQEQFAVRFQLPLGTVRDWERGAREPDTAAKNLLRVIDANPDAVVAALEHART